MTVLLDPDRGPHSLSVAGARALLAATGGNDSAATAVQVQA